MHMLICTADYLAAERILDTHFLQETHKLLKAEMLAVGIPRRGMPLATNAKGPEEHLKRFGAAVSAQYQRADTPPITPLVFIVLEGQIVGLMKGMEESEDQLDPEDPDSLVQGLAHSSPDVRKVAAERIGQKGYKEGIPPLAEALGDVDIEVRTTATKALSAYEQDVLDPLHSALKHSELRVRMGAVEFLGPLANPKSIPPLILAFGDDVLQVRMKAAESLSKIREPVVQDLSTAYEKGKDLLRECSMEVLLAIDTDRFGHLLSGALHDHFLGVRRRATYFLAKLADPDEFEALMQLTEDEDPSVRQLAVSGLTRLADPRSTDRLLAMVSEDPKGIVHGKAAMALGQLQETRAIPLILPLLRQGSNAIIHGYAAKALGDIGDPAALEALVDAMGDSHELVQGAAASAIRNYGEAAVRPLKQAQKALRREGKERSRILAGLTADCRLGKKY